jgi:hypothetical protein
MSEPTAQLVTCDMCGGPAPAALSEYGDTYCELCLAAEDGEKRGYREAALDMLDRAIDVMERAKFTRNEIHEALQIRLEGGSDSLFGSGIANTPFIEARFQLYRDGENAALEAAVQCGGDLRQIVTMEPACPAELSEGDQRRWVEGVRTSRRILIGTLLPDDQELDEYVAEHQPTAADAAAVAALRDGAKPATVKAALFGKDHDEEENDCEGWD